MGARMAGDVVIPEVVDELAARLASELRRLAWQIVQDVVEAEARARQTAAMADSLRKAFETVGQRGARAPARAARTPAAATPIAPPPPAPAPRPPAGPAAWEGASDDVAHVVTSTGSRAWVMPDDPRERPRAEPYGRARGIVKRFDDLRGYGFIVNDEGIDVFVHCKHILGRRLQTLQEGQAVEYREHHGERGRYATHVRPL
jgi:cold shock protein